MIKIAKNKNQYYVCAAVFSKPKKDWQWDEIVESWGDKSDLSNPMVVYIAAREVNKNIAGKTLIEDLLIVRKTTVRLNPQYFKR